MTTPARTTPGAVAMWVTPVGGTTTVGSGPAFSYSETGLGAVTVSGMILRSTAWPPTSAAVYCIPSMLTIDPGVTLTIAASTVVKVEGDGIIALGGLVGQGPTADPLMLTSSHDDAVTGDTNAVGPATKPRTNAWNDISEASSTWATSGRFSSDETPHV